MRGLLRCYFSIPVLKIVAVAVAVAVDAVGIASGSVGHVWPFCSGSWSSSIGRRRRRSTARRPHKHTAPMCTSQGAGWCVSCVHRLGAWQHGIEHTRRYVDATELCQPGIVEATQLIVLRLKRLQHAVAEHIGFTARCRWGWVVVIVVKAKQHAPVVAIEIHGGAPPTRPSVKPRATGHRVLLRIRFPLRRSRKTPHVAPIVVVVGRETLQHALGVRNGDGLRRRCRARASRWRVVHVPARMRCTCGVSHALHGEVHGGGRQNHSKQHG